MIGENFTFEELKQMLTDTKNRVSTEELLLLIDEFLGDEEISKVINEHVDCINDLFIYGGKR